MQCRIAVVQCTIDIHNPDRNVRKARKYIARAAKSGADIVVFPEYLMGWKVGNTDFVDVDHGYRTQFQNFAEEYKIAIVPGSLPERDGKRLYNTTYYIDSDGKILGRYRKVHLWLTERGAYSPGKKATVVSTKFGKIGLAICWDLAYPELFRSMVAEGAQIVLCPSYWCFGDAGDGVKYNRNSESTFVDALCIERAFENELFLVYCNAAGLVWFGRNRDKLIGHSQVTEPFKGVVKKIAHHREKMFLVNIETEILKIAEKSYRIRGDLKKHVTV